MADRPSISRGTRLRRADWRFLLPSPAEGSFRHLVLLGARGGLAERIVEVGLARRVSSEIPEERSADAVVVLRDARVALRDAADSLVRGGSLYWEIDRWVPSALASTPDRIRCSLRAAGLTPTGSYWVKPNFAHCEMYLPLDVQAALGWYMETLYTAATPLRWILEVGLRAVTGLKSRRFATLAPCHAVTAIAGPARDVAPSVLGHPVLPTELRRPDLRPVVLTGGEDDFNRVVVLPFAPGGTRPLAVVKLPRLPDRNIHTEREQAVLAEVRSCLDESMRRGIPRPLGTVRWGQLTAGVESYAPGRLLSSSSGRWRAPMGRKIDDLRLVTTWLAEFHRQAQVSRPLWGAPERSRWVETPLAAYTHAFGATADEERLFSEVRTRAGLLIGTPLPIVWQHHGFGEWNVCRAGNDIAVIDWESGDIGPAVTDLLYFVTHWSYTVRQLRGDAAQLRGFRELFVEPDRGGASSRSVHAAIAQYMARLDIDRRFLPLLLVLTWIERTVYQLDRRQALGNAQADARSGNRYVRYIGILAEDAGRLFADMAPSPR